MKTHILTRRRMIARSAVAALPAFAPHLSPLFADEKSRGFRIGACEWSLRKGDPSSMDLAREIGIDGVQVAMGTVENNLHLRKPEVQQAYLDAAQRNGIEVASIGIAEMNRVPLKSDPRAIEWLVDSIAVAQALEVKVILIAQFGNGNLKGDKPGIDRTVEILKEHASNAEKAGVIWGLENLLSAEENLDILDRVGSPAVQIYYDVGNSTDQGYDIYKEIRMIKGRVCEFHAKDGKFMLGAGRVDFKKVREAMDEIDYRGWIQIEAAAPTNLITDYQAHLALLKTHFPLSV
jgi:sugar phosphate isomerase/epimerase